MNLQLNSKIFKINCPQITGNIISFIKSKMTNLRKKGVVVPLSGGLDSSTVTALCVKAVGAENVIGLMLPEKQGNPGALSFGKKVCRHLNIQSKTINISRGLKALGAYNFILAKIPGRKARARAVRAALDSKGEAYLKYLRGEADPLHYKGAAVSYIKHRVRMVAVYKYAEENCLLVAGAAHKTEDMTGLFVKFGVDDCADIMPVKYLFRSHILQLAQFLKVPEEIIQRTPNPEIIAGVNDKYGDILNIEPEILDLILYGYEKGLNVKEISGQLDIPEEKIVKIFEIINLTEHQRNPSMAPLVL